MRGPPYTLRGLRFHVCAGRHTWLSTLAMRTCARLSGSAPWTYIHIYVPASRCPLSLQTRETMGTHHPRQYFRRLEIDVRFHVITRSRVEACSMALYYYSLWDRTRKKFLESWASRPTSWSEPNQIDATWNTVNISVAWRISFSFFFSPR